MLFRYRETAFPSKNVQCTIIRALSKPVKDGGGGYRVRPYEAVFTYLLSTCWSAPSISG
jgi:hypothetical protein